MEYNKLYLGDCYKIIQEIPDNSVDLVYTDIPYLMDMGGHKNIHSDLVQRIVNKKQELKDIKDGIDWSILDEFCRVCKKINVFIWCSKAQIPYLLNYFISKGCFFEILVWCKENPIPMCNNTWLHDLEYCLYFREKGVSLNDGYHLKSMWYSSAINKYDKDCFEHPTIKPIELVKRHIAHVTQPGDLVLDAFAGSGTTCAAAKELGRKYIGIEIDENYYRIAVDRLNGFNQKGEMNLFLMNND